VILEVHADLHGTSTAMFLFNRARSFCTARHPPTLFKIARSSLSISPVFLKNHFPWAVCALMTHRLSFLVSLHQAVDSYVELLFSTMLALLPNLDLNTVTTGRAPKIPFFHVSRRMSSFASFFHVKGYCSSPEHSLLLSRFRQNAVA